MVVLVWGVPTFGALNVVVSSSVDAWRQYMEAYEHVAGTVTALLGWFGFFLNPFAPDERSHLEQGRPKLSSDLVVLLALPPAWQCWCCSGSLHGVLHRGVSSLLS